MCVPRHWIAGREQRTQVRLSVFTAAFPRLSLRKQNKDAQHTPHTYAQSGFLAMADTSPRGFPAGLCPHPSPSSSSLQQLRCSRWKLQRKDRIFFLLGKADYPRAGRGLGKGGLGAQLQGWMRLGGCLGLKPKTEHPVLHPSSPGLGLWENPPARPRITSRGGVIVRYRLEAEL